MDFAGGGGPVRKVEWPLTTGSPFPSAPDCTLSRHPGITLAIRQTPPVVHSAGVTYRTSAMTRSFETRCFLSSCSILVRKRRMARLKPDPCNEVLLSRISANHFDVHTHPNRSRRCPRGRDEACRVDPFSADDRGCRCSPSGCQRQPQDCQRVGPLSL